MCVFVKSDEKIEEGLNFFQQQTKVHGDEDRKGEEYERKYEEEATLRSS